MRAEERDLKKPAFGKETKLGRNIGQDHRRIDVAGMVRNEDIGCFGVDVLQAFDSDFDSAR